MLPEMQIPGHHFGPYCSESLGTTETNQPVSFNKHPVAPSSLLPDSSSGFRSGLRPGLIIFVNLPRRFQHVFSEVRTPGHSRVSQTCLNTESTWQAKDSWCLCGISLSRCGLVSGMFIGFQLTLTCSQTLETLVR